MKTLKFFALCACLSFVIAVVDSCAAVITLTPKIKFNQYVPYAFSPRSTYLAVNIRDSSFDVWDLHSGEIRYSFPDEGYAAQPGMAFSHDESTLAIMNSTLTKSTIRFIDLQTGDIVRTLELDLSSYYNANPTGKGASLTGFFHNDALLAIWAGGGFVLLVDPNSGEILYSEQFVGFFNKLNEDVLLIGHSPTFFYSTGEKEIFLSFPKIYNSEFFPSTNPQSLYIWDRIPIDLYNTRKWTLRRWNYFTNDETYLFEGFKTVNAEELSGVSPTGEFFFGSGGDNHAPHLYRTETLEEAVVFQSTQRYGLFSPDGEFIMLTSISGPLEIFDISDATAGVNDYGMYE
ncbi:MAG: hypothetical protein GC154_07205 [bacterium]|nr:hypothetical protein [bacterium]